MMGLSCECLGDYDYFYACDDEFKKAESKHICYSCKAEINYGDLCLGFDTYEVDEDGNDFNNEYEYYCETCGEIFLNLDELGFCLNFEDNMRDMLDEYKREYLEMD